MICCCNYTFVYYIVSSELTLKQTFFLFFVQYQSFVFLFSALVVFFLLSWWWNSHLADNNIWLLQYFYWIFCATGYLVRNVYLKDLEIVLQNFYDTVSQNIGLNNMMFLCLFCLLLFLLTRLYLKSTLNIASLLGYIYYHSYVA